MDKLGEDEWAVDAVTSKFQVTIGRRPGFVYSTWGGLGWRFTFYDPGDPRIFTLLDTPELFIELGLTYVDRGPLNTSVTWCVFGRQIGVTSRVIPSGTTGKQSIGGSGFSAGWEAPVDAVLSLKVSFKPLLFRVTDPPQPAPPPFPARLLGTLEDAVTTGSFNDTKLYSYSCRDNDGRVHSPQALFVNSQLLREKSSYLDTLLFGNGFSEANDEDLDGGFPQTGKKVIDDYDYGSDSDLEEMEMDVDVQSSLRSGDDGAGSGAASRWGLFEMHISVGSRSK
ncbi:hypothetical protein JAAARDRAFT_272678 [Jaapia argillacea MUCL 33604]|uniref:Uncharacterized protein n=1 Tax=Jaapia argillacea MUCL 33604 TaxID=933084 RepID=A0A067Q530_9AGAM|nr:hypothetical protein JAAARDRAFT_272678 [Jaapia argillacea MUCL 33604]